MTAANGTPYVLTERRDKVLLVTLNRPEKRNPLSPELVENLLTVLDETARDESVNAVVLTGAGKVFCAGLDVSLLAQWGYEEKMRYLPRVTKVFQTIWELPQPVIAAVNGAAVAGGFDLAAFCDIRLAADDSVFCQAEINIGLTQIIHPLYKTIGLARAKELALTGQTISAAEAYRIGLVNHIYPADQVLEKALDMARLMASKSRFALLEGKRLTRELIDLDTKSALDEIGRSFDECLKSEEHLNQVKALFERISSTRKG